MASGDGLLARVKPRGGVLSARAARLLAGAAAGFGNGAVELTGRASLQVRGLSAASAPGFAAAMVAAGLGSPDAAAERRRSVIATPLAGADRAAHASSVAVTAALERALEEGRGLDGLPDKFGFRVDGGGVLKLGQAPADIGISLGADGAELSLEGGELAAVVAPGEAVAGALALARAFVAQAGGVRRMRHWVERVGEGAIFAGCGLAVRVATPVAVASAVGVHRLDQDEAAVGAGLAFGAASASEWAWLAELAEAQGDGALRLSPWRTVLIAGVADGGAALAALAGRGFIVERDDPRLRVFACVGRPGCASASVTTRAWAAGLRPAPGVRVHVSGCEKGCAHPGPASVTLVGRAGAFDLVRDGGAGDAPARFGLTPAEVRL